MRLYLVRHGRTESNQKQTFSGPDTQLDHREDGQLAAVSHYLHSLSFSKVLVSDYDRTLDTARLLGYSEAEREVRLRERNFGIFIDHNHQECERLYPEEYRRFMEDPVFYAIPGGESFEEVCQRVWPLLDELTEEERKGEMEISGFRPKVRSDEKILLITHFNVIAAALGWVFDSLSYSRNVITENGAILQIEVRGNNKALFTPRLDWLEREGGIPLH